MPRKKDRADRVADDILEILSDHADPFSVEARDEIAEEIRWELNKHDCQEELKIVRQLFGEVMPNLKLSEQGWQWSSGNTWYVSPKLALRAVINERIKKKEG